METGMKNAVTPQDYGAVGDGRTDDTAAFQKAVDSGYDVYVPTGRRETYRITRTIVITKTQCKRIFSEPTCRMTDSGAIIADFGETNLEPRGTALFDVRNQLLRINGLRFVSRTVEGQRAGLMIRAMDSDVCDYDIQLENCGIASFYRVAEFMGRGFSMLNCTVGSVNYLAQFNWDDSKDTNKNHPAMYDQRAIYIKNCRLHHISSGFLHVKSGHAYGLHFTGNTIDNGSGYLVKAAEQAWGWNISGNVIQGMRGKLDVMTFAKGIRNCVIANNTFLADEGYWAGSSGSVTSWLKCGGNTTGCVIHGNAFKNADGGFMRFLNLDGTAIVGNTFHNKMICSDPVMTMDGKCQRSTIVGNALASASAMRMFSKSVAKGNAVTGNCPEE